MIKINTLTKYLQDGLNQNTKNIFFKIVSDGGDYTPPSRILNDVTYYINGVMTSVGSSTYPVQALSVASLKAKLDLVISLDDYEDLPIEQNIELVQTILNDYFQTAQIQTMEDEQGKKYAVGISFSLVNTGTLEQRVGAAESITFSAYIDYAFVENGINSYNCTLAINGENIPYTSANISRAPIIDNNPFSGETGAENQLNTSSFGAEIQLPATLPEGSAISNAIIQYLLKGTPIIYDLTLNIAGESETIPVIIGKCSMSTEGVSNAVYSISFLNTEVLNG